MNTQVNEVDNIPSHLRDYVVEQNYEEYSTKEHNIWRYTMQQFQIFFKENAHPIYQKGLAATGIPVDRIPNIFEMNAALQNFGWSAVCVRGFIPPMVFLEFQSLRILPIAADIRTLKNISYTPAPDIIHEAAGHAPIIADEDYRAYLKEYNLIANKAIFSKQDMEIYECIRELSDMKENPDYTELDIKNAEKKLDLATKNYSWVSEASEISRLYWWTAEYGLIQDKNKTLIYGAGLLSSIEESKNCLNDSVKKIPLSLECIDYAYDITKEQPQLFVTESFKHLTKILREYEKTMAFKTGGLQALKKARLSKNITITKTDSDISICGTVEMFLSEEEQAIFVKWNSNTQLLLDNKTMQGHGYDYHSEGFSTPFGLWSNTTKLPKSLNDHDLHNIGIEKNKELTLTFVSGIQIKGTIKSWTRNSRNELIMISWKSCDVIFKNQVLFNKDWGVYDMLVVNEVTSIQGCNSLKLLPKSTQIKSTNTTSPKSIKAKDYKTRQLDLLYDEMESIRSGNSLEPEKQLETLSKKYIQGFLHEWLLGLNLLEIAKKTYCNQWKKTPWVEEIINFFMNDPSVTPQDKELILDGLNLLKAK